MLPKKKHMNTLFTMLLRGIEQILEKYSGVSLHMLWIGSINSKKLYYIYSWRSPFHLNIEKEFHLKLRKLNLVVIVYVSAFKLYI